MKTIKVEVKILGKNKLILTEHLGDGTVGEIKFEASFTLPVRSLIVKIGDYRYFVNVQKVIQAVVEMHETNNQLKKEEGGENKNG